MNIEELTLGQAKEIMRLFVKDEPSHSPINNGMVGRYVIVRCSEAGVHCGFLEAHNGRECVLTYSRRLWYWKPLRGKWLSAVANNGLHQDSKISESVDRIHLTENCEIILCKEEACTSIRNMESSSE